MGGLLCMGPCGGIHMRSPPRSSYGRRRRPALAGKDNAEKAKGQLPCTRLNEEENKDVGCTCRVRIADGPESDDAPHGRATASRARSNFSPSLPPQKSEEPRWIGPYNYFKVGTRGFQAWRPNAALHCHCWRRSYCNTKVDRGVGKEGRPDSNHVHPWNCSCACPMRKAIELARAHANHALRIRSGIIPRQI